MKTINYGCGCYIREQLSDDKVISIYLCMTHAENGALVAKLSELAKMLIKILKAGAV